MTDILDSMLAGFGVILGVALVLTTTNVIMSYVLPEGATLSEYLNNKLNLEASQ